MSDNLFERRHYQWIAYQLKNRAAPWWSAGVGPQTVATFANALRYTNNRFSESRFYEWSRIESHEPKSGTSRTLTPSFTHAERRAPGIVLVGLDPTPVVYVGPAMVRSILDASLNIERVRL